jgi:hypothetical protein
MKHFLLCETIDIELVAHIQAIVTHHVDWSLCTKLWNKLDHLPYMVKRNYVPKRPAIGSKSTLDYKHFESWGRTNYTDIVHNCIKRV